MNKIQIMIEKLYNQICALIPSASGKMLTNKWVLYFIFIVGFYDVINFYQQGNMTAFAIFFIVGFLTAFFSKNMIVIIVTAIAVSHLVTYGNKMSEGLKNKQEEEEEDEEEEDEGFEEGVDEEEDVEEEENTMTEEDEEEEDTTKKTKKKESFCKLGDPTCDQTADLLKKQTELMAKMNKLQPLLDKAESLIKTHETAGFQNMTSTNSNSFSEYR
jgi:hypothetical protein